MVVVSAFIICDVLFQLLVVPWPFLVIGILVGKSLSRVIAFLLSMAGRPTARSITHKTPFDLSR